MIVPLKQAYPCRYGVPVLTQVDTRIFTLSYYGDCMGCTFCNDACCKHGVDVTAVDLANIAGHAQELERHVGRPRDQWFTGETDTAADWPGGHATRTRTADGHCVFHNSNGRGCLIHQFASERGIDIHEIKPMVCLLWPVTWLDHTLRPSDEVRDNDIICVGPGQTCYRSSRNDIGYFFGPDLLTELDDLEQGALATASAATAPAASRSLVRLTLMPSQE